MPTQKVKEEPKFPKVEFHPNDIVLNKYRILNRLGSGGMSSIVYKAEDVNIKNDEFFANKEKNVAIKVVNRDET
jgi:serine/threonine protein kinase